MEDKKGTGMADFTFSIEKEIAVLSESPKGWRKELKTSDILPAPFITNVNSISLMWSHRENGKLIYTEIYKVEA